jgi:DNA-binding beta-propeller fold protein YncE
MGKRANCGQRSGVQQCKACALGLCLIAFALEPVENCGFATGSFARESAAQTAGSGAQHVKFVREFSGPQDVSKGLPPALNRSMDILLGRADPKPTSEKMSRPYSVVTDSAHRIYVTDPSQGLVHIFDFEKSRYSSLGGAGSQLKSPVGLAVDENDNLYVTDSVLGMVLVFGPNGKFLKYLGKVGGGEPYFASPSGIAVEKEGERIYVCDAPRHMVILLDKEGHILGHIGKRRGGNGPGEFRYPTRIVISGQEVAVLDSGNSRLEILDLEGHYRREIKIPELSVETGLAVDAQKQIYVGNLTLDSIDVFTRDGQFLYRFGSLGKGAGEFDRPCGIWVDSRGGLYVTDMRNARVEMFQLEGQP